MLCRMWVCFLALQALAYGAVAWPDQHKPRFGDIWTPLMNEWDQPFNVSEQVRNAAVSKEMFVHAFNSYMSYGFPQDNVRPISCRPSNSQGGVGLTLLDSLDSLLLFGMEDDFRRGLRLIEEHVHFNSSTRVHVFELTIRALGGLLASHIAVTQNKAIAPSYNGILLTKAQELAQQLLPAFNTSTGIPVSWVNLKSGRIPGDVEHTCVACAVTLAVEFRMLSHLTSNPIYRQKVDHAVSTIYARREPNTHLVGNTLWTTTGEWERHDAGIGAGADSYYEYLLKTYLIFGDESYLEMFVDQYVSVQRHMTVQSTWQGFSWLLDVHMSKLSAVKGWVSSLSAFWPALQASIGQLQEAHMLFSDYIAAFSHFGWIPEQVSVLLNQVHPSESAYPLRPEVAESAFALWAASGEPRYQRAGAGILETISTFNSAPCGYSSVRNIATGNMEDGMESFFLAETAKYLFLLFSNATAVLDHFVLSTEGHLLPVLPPVPKEPLARTVHDVHAESALLTQVSSERCPLLWRQQECADVCRRKTQQLLKSEAAAAHAQFPAIHFDVNSARLLRQRRCRVCRKVVDAYATNPPLPPCMQAETLGVRLDRPCGAEDSQQQEKSTHPRGKAAAEASASFRRAADAAPTQEEAKFDLMVDMLRKAAAGEIEIKFKSDEHTEDNAEDHVSSGMDPEELSTDVPEEDVTDASSECSAGTCTLPTDKSVKGQHSKGSAAFTLGTRATVDEALKQAMELIQSRQHSTRSTGPYRKVTFRAADKDDALTQELQVLLNQLSAAGTGTETEFTAVTAPPEQPPTPQDLQPTSIDIQKSDLSLHAALSELELQAQALRQLSEATSALVQAVSGSAKAGGVEAPPVGGLERLTGAIAELEKQLAKANGVGAAAGIQDVETQGARSEGAAVEGDVSKYADEHQPQQTCAATLDHDKVPPDTYNSHDGGLIENSETESSSADAAASVPDEVSEEEGNWEGKQGLGDLSDRLVAYAICFLRTTSERGLRCSRTPVLPSAGLSIDILSRLLPANIAVAQVIAKPRNMLREQATVAIRMQCMHTPTPACTHGSTSSNLVLLTASGASFGPIAPQFPGISAAISHLKGPPASKASGEDASAACMHSWNVVDEYSWLMQVNEVMGSCAALGDKSNMEIPEENQPREPPAQTCACNALPLHFNLPPVALDSEASVASHSLPEASSGDSEDSNDSENAENAHAHTAHSPPERLEGPVVVAEPLEACGELQNDEFRVNPDGSPKEGSMYDGAVVLVARGSCMFHEKAVNVQRSGAAAMIVANGPQWHIGQFIARWDEQGGIGWGIPKNEDEGEEPQGQVPPNQQPNALEMSPEVFLMSSGGTDWEDIETVIPSVMVSGPHAAALVAAATCMHGHSPCRSDTDTDSSATDPQQESSPPETTADEPAAAALSNSDGDNANDLCKCEPKLFATVFSGVEDQEEWAPVWEMEWRVLMAANANSWIQGQEKANRLVNSEPEVNNALVRDLLPVVNEWAQENHGQFSSFPPIDPDTDVEHPSTAQDTSQGPPDEERCTP